MILQRKRTKMLMLVSILGLKETLQGLFERIIDLEKRKIKINFSLQSQRYKQKK